MKVSERLYNSIIDLWDKYNEHPFVKGLADGDRKSTRLNSSHP